MPTSEVILDDAELAKSYITNSPLSDEYKKLYLRLINIATIATNGISTEEKIQKMTECIQLLAITQGMYLSNIDGKIEKAIKHDTANRCSDCKAMTYVTEIEEEEQQNELLENYLKKHGITESQQDSVNNQKSENLLWMDVLKTILTKPYIYVVLSLLLISPYSVNIVTVICQFLAK